MGYRDLKDKEGEEAANFILTQVYCRQGNPLLAPSRFEAIELVKKMAESIGNRDSDAFQEASERLNEIGGTGLLVSQQEQTEILWPIISKDPEGAMAFIRANSSIGDLSTNQGQNDAKGKHYREMDKRINYLNFRLSGIGYGPRFRGCDFGVSLAGDRPVEDDLEILAYGVNKTQSAADDWERKVLLSPSTIDSSMHTGATVDGRNIKMPEKGKGK